MNILEQNPDRTENFIFTLLTLEECGRVEFQLKTWFQLFQRKCFFTFQELLDSR